MEVRFSGWISSLAFLALALGTGCNRGARPSQMGKVAPDFTVSDGRTSVHLADYRGKVVMVNFWATWCGPCVMEMPSLLALHREMPDMVILAISVDEDENAYTSFLARRHVDLITVRDPEEKTAALFHTDMWPETYVIDRKGVIQRKFIGAQDWGSSEIRSYLKSL